MKKTKKAVKRATKDASKVSWTFRGETVTFDVKVAHALAEVFRKQFGARDTSGQTVDLESLSDGQVITHMVSLIYGAGPGSEVACFAGLKELRDDPAAFTEKALRGVAN